MDLHRIKKGNKRIFNQQRQKLAKQNANPLDTNIQFKKQRKEAKKKQAEEPVIVAGFAKEKPGDLKKQQAQKTQREKQTIQRGPYPPDVIEPAFSLKYNPAKHRVAAVVQLPHVPEKFIKLDPTPTHFILDTEGWSKRYYLNVRFPQKVEINEETIATTKGDALTCSFAVPGEKPTEVPLHFQHPRDIRRAERDKKLDKAVAAQKDRRTKINKQIAEDRQKHYARKKLFNNLLDPLYGKDNRDEEDNENEDDDYGDEEDRQRDAGEQGEGLEDIEVWNMNDQKGAESEDPAPKKKGTKMIKVLVKKKQLVKRKKPSSDAGANGSGTADENGGDGVPRTKKSFATKQKALGIIEELADVAEQKIQTKLDKEQALRELQESKLKRKAIKKNTEKSKLEKLTCLLTQKKKQQDADLAVEKEVNRLTNLTVARKRAGVDPQGSNKRRRVTDQE